MRRLGGERLIPLDVRVVVATNRDVNEMVADGRMRADLYYRLSVVRLRVPPLRERRDDIPQLVPHFIERAALRHHREIKRVAGAAMRVLRDHPWPGNVPPAPQRHRATWSSPSKVRPSTSTTCPTSWSPSRRAPTRSPPSKRPSPRRNAPPSSPRSPAATSTASARRGSWASASAPSTTR